MSLNQPVNISLSSQESRWVQKALSSGKFSSPNQVVHEGLRRMLVSARAPRTRKRQSANESTLAKAYREAAERDRKLSAEWSELTEAWPEN